MVMYNKRNMEFLTKEMERGEHKYLREVLALLGKAEEGDRESFQIANIELDRAIPKLIKHDETGWRRELLLNYYLNLELHYFKEADDKHTKWTVFIEKVKENNWKTVEKFIEEIDVYMSSQNEPNNELNSLTEERMAELNQKYETKVKPYIERNLGPVDKFRAELRIEQRLNLIKRKVPVNSKVNFGDWIKEKRNAKQWSLQTLAEKSGYSPAYIYRIEKGTRKNPTPQVVSKIVAALGYEPETYLNLLLQDDEDSQAEPLKKIELSDLIQLNAFTVNGKEVSDDQRAALVKIVELINEDDVLQVPKINELKEKIREYQA